MLQPFITIEEQGLRDGLQTLPATIPIHTKIEWVNALIEAGLRRIQVTSFVNPRLVPQMADAEALIAALPNQPDVVFSALVLNSKGVERAAACGMRQLAISLSASDTHSKKNANKNISDAKLAFAAMMMQARANGIKVRGGIQCAFGCRYEGKISESLVLDLVKHHLDNGANEIALADSTGMANPIQIKNIAGKALALCKNIPLTLHLHNTENKGYANMVAAVETGVTHFDTAFGGLGGCPFIKNATGNIATEDSVHLLHEMGYSTGIDIAKVAYVSSNIQLTLGHALPGLLYQLIANGSLKTNLKP
jgi:hydroxymethylglutaryl-CoA lyase